MNTINQFQCKCGKRTGWIGDKTVTEPCPQCGRKYIGKYSRKKLTIIAKEL